MAGWGTRGFVGGAPVANPYDAQRQAAVKGLAGAMNNNGVQIGSTGGLQYGGGVMYPGGSSTFNENQGVVPPPAAAPPTNVQTPTSPATPPPAPVNVPPPSSVAPPVVPPLPVVTTPQGNTTLRTGVGTTVQPNGPPGTKSAAVVPSGAPGTPVTNGSGPDVVRTTRGGTGNPPSPVGTHPTTTTTTVPLPGQPGSGGVARIPGLYTGTETANPALTSGLGDGTNGSWLGKDGMKQDPKTWLTGGQLIAYNTKGIDPRNYATADAYNQAWTDSLGMGQWVSG